MSTLIFGLLGGGGFVVLGRWIYSNPTTMYVSSLGAGRENSLPELGARIFATLLIFLGSFGATAAPAAMLLHRAAAITLTAATAGALGAWLLRPRVVAAPRGAAGSPEGVKTRRGPSLTRKGKVLLATMAAGVVLSTAEALGLPALGRGALWPDAALVTILAVAAGMLSEMLFVK